MKEMVGGCCVCSDERGWTENPLVYCDGQGCNVAVHQACYGIVQVPTGPWFCRKCESQERSARVRCELCPSKDGALKRTDSTGWAHVVCALYIPEVRFGNVTTMEPIILQLVPQERYNKVCCICEEQGKEGKSSVGACMQCNKAGCKQYFHVTCAQAAGLLCEEAGNYMDNVKYCGYCHYHYQKLKKVSNIKTIPAFKPIPADNATPEPSPEKRSPAHLKEKIRSRGEKKAKQSTFAVSSGVNNSSSATTLSAPLTVEQGHQSDSSTSTLSNSSVNSCHNNCVEANGSMDSVDKKAGSNHSSKSSISSKFTTANFKETVITPSGSPVFGTEKHKNKRVDDCSSIDCDKTVLVHQDIKCSTRVAPVSSPVPTFNSMYENFISSDMAANSEISQERKAEFDGKRPHSFLESSEKKKTKHSRNKAKASKDSLDITASSLNINHQIPIVRIRRNYLHDKSSSSHSIEEMSVKENPINYDASQNDHNSSSINLNQGVETENINPESLPIDNDENDNEMACKAENLNLSNATHVSENFLKPIANMAEKMENKQAADANGLPPVPQTLEQLLERQWEQGSNFLMEQAQHFDIASLLNCLHQLRSENQRLDSHVKTLVTRRDHLLGVNARLRLPLNTIVPYSSLSVGERNPVMNSQTMGCSGYMSLDGGVHSTQDAGYRKSPVTGHSPAATVGSSSLPLTPSPVPSSPTPRPGVLPQLAAFVPDSSPLGQATLVTSAISQPSHSYSSSFISNPLLMTDANSYKPIGSDTACLQGQDQSSAVYQSISPPFSSPGTSSSSNHPLQCSNIVFHQSYQTAPHNTDTGMEDNR